jgi:type VI secretion system protein ImpL
VFQLMPLQSPGVAEFTVEVDGQQLRYRNSAPAWTNMVHPAPGAPGARITAVTADGRTVELLNEVGPQALKRMIETAARKPKDGGVFELRWSSGAVTVALDLKVVSTPDAPAPQTTQGFRGLRLPATIVGRDAAAPGPGTIAHSGIGGGAR